MTRGVDVGTSWASSVLRGGVGTRVGPLGPRPEQPVELYDFEACPFCRKVREALSILDLDAKVFPCPRGGKRYRPQVASLGGKTQFPYLIDRNTGNAMYESDDIVAYLFRTYGTGRPPATLKFGSAATAQNALASLPRAGRGLQAVPSRTPDQPLELYSFESSPFCRLVREELTSLELPYVLHNVAKGSPKRSDFVARSGKMQVPWISDPNTGTEMFESADIVRYLHATYGA